MSTQERTDVQTKTNGCTRAHALYRSHTVHIRLHTFKTELRSNFVVATHNISRVAERFQVYIQKRAELRPIETIAYRATFILAF